MIVLEGRFMRVYYLHVLCILHNNKKNITIYYDRTDEACISLTPFNGRLNIKLYGRNN